MTHTEPSGVTLEHATKMVEYIGLTARVKGDRFVIYDGAHAIGSTLIDELDNPPTVSRHGIRRITEGRGKDGKA
jgi:hypothetical protein